MLGFFSGITRQLNPEAHQAMQATGLFPASGVQSDQERTTTTTTVKKKVLLKRRQGNRLRFPKKNDRVYQVTTITKQSERQRQRQARTNPAPQSEAQAAAEMGQRVGDEIGALFEGLAHTMQQCPQQ